MNCPNKQASHRCSNAFFASESRGCSGRFRSGSGPIRLGNFRGARRRVFGDAGGALRVARTAPACPARSAAAGAPAYEFGPGGSKVAGATPRPDRPLRLAGAAFRRGCVRRRPRLPRPVFQVGVRPAYCAAAGLVPGPAGRTGGSVSQPRVLE